MQIFEHLIGIISYPMENFSSKVPKAEKWLPSWFFLFVHKFSSLFNPTFIALIVNKIFAFRFNDKHKEKLFEEINNPIRNKQI